MSKLQNCLLSFGKGDGIFSNTRKSSCFGSDHSVVNFNLIVVKRSIFYCFVNTQIEPMIWTQKNMICFTTIRLKWKTAFTRMPHLVDARFPCQQLLSHNLHNTIIAQNCHSVVWSCVVVSISNAAHSTHKHTFTFLHVYG